MDKADARRKHDALIARANSTTFPAEADACRAKAAELYEAHGLRARREYSVTGDRVMSSGPLTDLQWQQWFGSGLTMTTTGDFGGVTIRIVHGRR